MLKELFSIRKNRYAKTDQLRYLSQSALIEETVAPHMVRTTLFMVSIIIISLIIWAGLTDVEEIAITQGDVVPSKHVQSIQHLEGGIVSEINISEGDLVDKGQTLITLDGTAVKQDLSALKARKLSLQYQAHRLRSFINHTKPDFASIPGTSDKELEEEQLRAFNSMIKAREDEKDIIEKQITQREAALNVLEKQKITLTNNLKLISEEHKLKKRLTDKGHLSKFRFMETQKKFNDASGELAETKAEIVQAQNSISEYKERLESLSARHIDEAYQQLNLMETDLSQVQENIEKLQDEVKRLEIKSPSYGFIKGLKVKTIGGVIESGQVLVEVVPLEGKLIIETRIQTKDVGHVTVGQNVNVKVSSYDFSRYGTIDGTLEYISATTFIDDDGSRYYLGKVSLKQKYVGNDPKRNLIVPGMTVQADIVTGSKSILAYLLKPIHTSVTTAFTER